GSNGKFSWGNGQRVYYGNLTTAFSTTVEFSFPNPVFHGFVGVAVSRLDNPTAATVANKNNWKSPVIVTSTTGETSFLDKEQNGFGYSGCTVRTDSHGVVYLFAERFAFPSTLPTHSAQVMFKSFDGGIHWTSGSVIASVTDPCYFVDPIEGRCVMDGYSGART